MDSKADNFRKGKGVRYQIDCWNGLLEGRIKLQKALSLCNQLPQYHTAKSYISTDCCSEAHSTCEVALTELLDELFGLQRAISDKRTDINSFFSVALRNEVLEKWSQKLQLASGRLTMRTYQYQNHSIVSAIEHILKDKPRLIRRTQLKRSSFKIIGNVDNQFPKTSRESPRNSHLKEVDSEIFDDGDFYHQVVFVNKSCI
jgi:protein AATF/BFR2